MRNTGFLLTWALIISISSSILSVIADDPVPVLIWGGDSSNTDSSPVSLLQKTSQLDFQKIVAEKVGTSQPPVLVFLKDNLCVEDFVQHRKDLMQLKKAGSLLYLPAVESPLSVFENLTSYNQSMEEDLESVSEGQLIITKAIDLDAVSETFNMIKESSPNLISALIGRSCIYSRSGRTRRAADEKADDKTPFIISVNESRLLMYADESPIFSENGGGAIELGLPASVTESGEGTSVSPLIVKMLFNANAATNATKQTVALEIGAQVTGYYYLKRIEIMREEKSVANLTSRTEIVFPRNFSYHCASDIVFNSKTPEMNITFKNLQIQIDAKNFTDAYDCVGFSTIPIWSGLFVTFILAIIMIWGITMIMDIRTMDRFDDPKGKTITISAQE